MLSWSHKHHYPMCHAVAAAAPAVHCNGIQPYKGAAWEEGRLLLLSWPVVAQLATKASQTLHAYAGTIPIVFI